jgi:hypothetical protein
MRRRKPRHFGFQSWNFFLVAPINKRAEDKGGNAEHRRENKKSKPALSYRIGRVLDAKQEKDAAERGQSQARIGMVHPAFGVDEKG